MAISCGYSNPIDYLRYVLTCQNWGDNESGEPSASALIRTGAGVPGSFDSVTLDEIKAIGIRHQVDDINNGNTKDIIEKICKQFNLVQYTDIDGYECVKYLFANASDAAIPLFTLQEVIEVGDYVAPDQMKICVNPVIDYDYDYGLGAFTKQLRVDNVQRDTYVSGYTAGFTAGDAQAAWDTCKDYLWPLCRRIEDMDSGWRENDLIYTYAGAIFRFENIVRMMRSARITFTVPFDLAYSLAVGSLVDVSFPHLDYSEIGYHRGTVLSVSRDYMANTVEIECLLYDMEVPIASVLQDNDSDGEVLQDNDSSGTIYQESDL